MKIIEVSPINFLLRSAREQRNIIYSFVSYLKISPAKIQFKVLTKKADVNRHLYKIEDRNLKIPKRRHRKLTSRNNPYRKIRRKRNLKFPKLLHPKLPLRQKLRRNPPLLNLRRKKSKPNSPTPSLSDTT